MPAPDEFALDVAGGDERTVIRVSGELDLGSAPQLEAAIAAEPARSARSLVIDLRETVFMDSTGLRAVLAAARQARESGRRFAVTHGGEQVQRIFSVTGADSRLEVLADPEDA